MIKTDMSNLYSVSRSIDKEFIIATVSEFEEDKFITFLQINKFEYEHESDFSSKVEGVSYRKFKIKNVTQAFEIIDQWGNS